MANDIVGTIMTGFNNILLNATRSIVDLTRRVLIGGNVWEMSI